MNKIINLVSIIAVVVAILLLSYLSSAPTSVSAAFTDFPVGQSRLIDFDSQKDSLEGLSRREQLDQLRDWLLFTTVSASGLPPEEINQSMFDVPAIRQGYMQPVANFDFGDTRSCYIGRGQVIALLPPSNGQERASRLAQIVDQQRKNLGEKPEIISVFEYRLDADPNLESVSATLTRQETLNASELFTEKYGYYESEIKNLADLQQFVGQVEDITYARLGDHLTLGGRKILSHPYRGIGLEDVAAIWKSEAKIQTGLSAREKKLEDFNNRWKHRTYSSQMERLNLEEQYKREEEALDAELEAEMRESKLANGSGFSLDPTYDFDALKKEFDSEIAPLLRVLLDDDSGSADPGYNFEGGQFKDTSSDSKIEKAHNGLEKRDIGPLLELLSELSSSNNPKVQMIESYMKRKYKSNAFTLAEGLAQDFKQRYGFQAARYDGDLKGTEVGMVLFYTDLLAKLWALDHKHSAPQREVRDFKSLPATRVSTIYKKELRELNNTRLWFGPQAKGFQVADGGNSMLFAHTATRVYAASSNSLKPGVESQANTQSASFLGWWDDHYEEIARFEPQYERLNEIMKWSLLIGWLNEGGHGDKLGFLNGVDVYRENWFPEWAKKNGELKFRDWESIKFFERGHKGSDTEALPLLKSDEYQEFGEPITIAGGVSLADKGLFKSRVALSGETKITQLVRRSNLDYSASKAAGEAISFEGTSYSFKALAPDRAVMTASAKEGVKLRGAYGEVANLKFERLVSQETGGLNISTKLGEVEMGNLEIGRTGNGFKVGWRGRDIDRGQSLARRLSETNEPSKILLSDGRVESVINLGDNKGYIVKLRDSDRWLQLSPESETAGVSKWQSRVGSFSEDAHNYEIAWKNSDELQSTLAYNGNITVAPVEGFASRYQLKLGSEGLRAGGRELEIQSGDVIAKGRLNPQTGEVHFRYSELPETLRSNPLKLQRLVAEAGITPERTHYIVSDLADGNSLLQQFQSGNTRSLMNEIISSPSEFKMRVGREFTESVTQSDLLLANGQYRDAVRQLDSLIDVYGQRPELLLRRGVAKLSDRLPEASAPLQEALLAGKGKDPALFFREVNERLRLKGVLPDNMSIVNEGGDIALHCRLDSLSGRAAVAPGELESGRVLVYVQDSPGLNNLDWNVSVNQSLHQAISGDLGIVVKLPRGDIAKLKPTLIYLPDGATSYHAISQTGTNLGYRFPRYYYGMNFNDDEEKEKEKDKEKEEYIYFVLAKRG